MFHRSFVIHDRVRSAADGSKTILSRSAPVAR